MSMTVLPSIVFVENLHEWLVKQAKAYDLRWLLAHADDGINWGYIENDQLKLSYDCYPDYAPPLRATTLQQVRLFGDKGELYLWPDEHGWRGRFLDGSRDDTVEEQYEVQYLLWGTTQEDSKDGFLLLTDGQEGLRHALPLPADVTFHDQETYLALTVRHYLSYDEDGQAYVAASRSVKLITVERGKEGNKQ